MWKTEKEKLDDERKKLDLQVQELVKDKLKDGETARFRNQWGCVVKLMLKIVLALTTGFQRYIVTKEKIYFENDYNSDPTSVAASIKFGVLIASSN
ncbi:hypothetical protein [Acinetobacter baumannii]|uniref:hypothetical protein n=1 Tax=Acinetobacter baumannii TaxID=470 RepID=UPI001F50F0C8|nr:hypothetical protein [Acinetobacter baumannii]UNI12455.1 hypothetical protein L2M54_05970 [Acinetobacter baumannii]